MTESIDDSKPKRKHLTLDAGVVDWEGKKVPVKGELIFEFIHEVRTPNPKVVVKLEEQLKNWLHQKLPDTLSLPYLLKLLKFTSVSLSCFVPEWYINEEIHHKKLFFLNVFGLLEWTMDNLDDGVEFRSDPNYWRMLRFISTTLYKIFTGEFKNVKELHQNIAQLGFFNKSPLFLDCLILWFHLAEGLQQDLQITPDQLKGLAEILEHQYDSNCWLEGPGNKQVESESLQATLRLLNNGGPSQIMLTSLMEGLYEPTNAHAVREKHLKRLKFLVITAHSMMNDVVSLKKEVEERSYNNFILLWCRQGLSLEESVAKAFEKHDEYLKEAEKIYEFVQRAYADDPAVLLYADIIVKSFSGNIQFSWESGRYGEIKRTFQFK